MAGYVFYSLDWDKFQQFVEHPTPAQLAALGQRLAEGLEEWAGEFDETDPLLTWPSDAAALAPLAAQRLAMPDWYGDLSEAGKNLWEGAIFALCMNDDADLGFRVDSDGVYWDVIELAWKELGVVPEQISNVALSAFGVRPYRYHPRPATEKTREQFDRDEDARRASLNAMSDMLGQLLQGLKEGGTDPSRLLEKIDQTAGVSQEHKNALKNFLGDEEVEEEDEEPWHSMHSMHTPAEVQTMLAELRSVAGAMAQADPDTRQQFEDDLLPTIERVAADGRLLFIQVDT